MAEQAAEGEARAAGAAPGVSVKMVILAALVALIAGLGGAVAFFKFAVPQKQAESSSTQQAQSGTGAQGGQPGNGVAGLGTIVDLDPFIVNLADQPDVRYLKLTVKVAIDSPEAEELLVSRMAPIRDTILVLLSSKESEDLRSAQGKFHLREDITQRINGVLPRPLVKNTYFTEFVVQ